MNPGGEESETPGLVDAAATPGSNTVREVLGAIPPLARAAWFLIGALVATVVTLLFLVRPWTRHATAEHSMPYEIFPFADNAGVCQEWVAIANLETTHDDAVAVVRRLASTLPADVRPDNLRVVRAFAAGDRWTVAVDAQPGAGDEAHASAIAQSMNTVPGSGLRFHAVFYASHTLYDTAHVLCMPRTGVAPREAAP